MRTIAMNKVFAVGIAGVLLSLAASAAADPPGGTPPGHVEAKPHKDSIGKPENKIEKADKSDKVAEKIEKGDKSGDKEAAKSAPGGSDRADGKKNEERSARAKTLRDAERKAVEPLLQGKSMTESLRQELQRHARRLARLERAKMIAIERKDNETKDRILKLIDKETARHDKFLAKFAPTTATPTTAGPAAAPPTETKGAVEPKKAVDEKGGAK